MEPSEVGEVKQERAARLYVVGPVTGRDGLNRKAFEDARDALEDAGYTVLIPHYFIAPDAPWHKAMRASIETLVKCDGIALLDGWESSRGARIENDLAASIGMDTERVAEWLERSEKC